MRLGAVQVGFDATVVHVGADDTERIARLSDVGVPQFEFGDGLWAVGAATLRGVYSGVSARRFSGEPESFQVSSAPSHAVCQSVSQSVVQSVSLSFLYQPVNRSTHQTVGLTTFCS